MLNLLSSLSDLLFRVADRLFCAAKAQVFAEDRSAACMLLTLRVVTLQFFNGCIGRATGTLRAKKALLAIREDRQQWGGYHRT
jgi:hypothetical protein